MLRSVEIPRRPDLAGPIDRLALLGTGVARWSDLPLRARLQAALFGIAPIAAWLVSGTAVTRRDAPFTSYWFLLLFGMGLFVIALPGVLVSRRTRTRGKPPGVTAIAVATIVAFVIAQVAALFEPFRLPEPVAVPGEPVLHFAAAPYGTFDLWVARGGGDVRDGSIASLARFPGNEGSPSVSPDGTQLVYASDVEGTFDLYVLSLSDGAVVGEPRRITSDHLGDEYEARWSPDGGWIAFTQRTGDDQNIVLIRPDGTGRHAITDDGDSSGPTWSLDGGRVAFSRPTADDPDDLAIWDAARDGDDDAVLVDTQGHDFGLFWLRDGTHFAFSARIGSDTDTWTGASGEAAMDVTPGTPRSDEVVHGVGPEGHILFISDRAPASGSFLYFMDPDGSDVHLAAIA
jgi:Tol biopolymer transport system component